MTVSARWSIRYSDPGNTAVPGHLSRGRGGHTSWGLALDEEGGGGGREWIGGQDEWGGNMGREGNKGEMMGPKGKWGLGEEAGVTWGVDEGCRE